MVTTDTAGTGTHRSDTRSRLLETALRLFGEHGVDGASLQMIADELGVTKAAVYYHFKTKHEIVDAVASPALRELTEVLERAEAKRGHGPRLDALLDGLVEIVVRYRSLIALFLSDPGFGHSLGGALEAVENIKERVSTLARGEHNDPYTRVTTHFAIVGLLLGGSGPELADVDDDTLRDALRDSGRRLLRRPRKR